MDSARSSERPDPLRRLAADGWLAAPLPPEQGGAGRHAAAIAVALADAFAGSGDGGLALAWAGHTLGCALPIARLGRDDLRRGLLPGLAGGSTIGAWAHHEVARAGDPLGLAARAQRTPRGWVLDGRKVRVVNAARADLFVVTAITDASRGPAGVSAFVVERGDGLVTPASAGQGPADAAIGDLALDHVHVPEDRILGAPGEGLGGALRLVQRWERGLAAAPWIGLLRAALARAAAHARTHVRFGAPLASSQAHRARLADAAIRLALCERVLARGARLLDRGGGLDADGDLALARGRLFLGESIASLARELASLVEPDSLAGDHPSARLAGDAASAGLLGAPLDVLRAIVAGALTGLG